MVKFIEIEDIRGHRIAINVNYIQTIRDVTDEPTLGNTGILLNNDIVQTNLEYSKVIELIRSNPKKKGFRLWQ